MVVQEGKGIFLNELPVLPVLLCFLLGADLGAGGADHVFLCLFEGVLGAFGFTKVCFERL